MSENTVLRNVYLPPEMDDELRILSYELGATRAEIILWCVKRGVKSINTIQRYPNSLDKLKKELLQA